MCNGSYLGCLPYLDVEQEVERGELVILNTPDLNMQRSLSFVWLNEDGDNPLRDCIRSEAKRLVKQRERRLKEQNKA